MKNKKHKQKRKKEQWKSKNEKWNMKKEKWKTKNEKNNEKWKTKNEKWKTKMKMKNEKRKITRLGLQCQTPSLSKVYFTWEGTIILGLKKFGLKKLKMKIFLIPQKFYDPKKETKSTPWLFDLWKETIRDK